VTTFNFTPGQPVRLWTCDGRVSQEFMYQSSDMTFRTFFNQCLDVPNGHFLDGQTLWIANCVANINQQWLLYGDGTTRPQVSQGLCVDAFGPSSADGAAIGLRTCNGQDSQKWLTSALGSATPFRATGDTWENHGVYYNPFPGGYCTWGAMENWYEFTGNHLYVTGDAQYWNTQAQAAGWTVTDTPTANSIVVFQPGVNGALNGGHNGWVTGINANGTVHVLEMNDLDLAYGGGTSPNFTWDYRDYTVVPGMSFILAPGTRQHPLPF
jgi:surface antigen